MNPQRGDYFLCPIHLDQSMDKHKLLETIICHGYMCCNIANRRVDMLIKGWLIKPN